MFHNFVMIFARFSGLFITPLPFCCSGTWLLFQHLAYLCNCLINSSKCRLECVKLQRDVLATWRGVLMCFTGNEMTWTRKPAKESTAGPLPWHIMSPFDCLLQPTTCFRPRSFHLPLCDREWELGDILPSGVVQKSRRAFPARNS